MEVNRSLYLVNYSLTPTHKHSFSVVFFPSNKKVLNSIKSMGRILLFTVISLFEVRVLFMYIQMNN